MRGMCRVKRWVGEKGKTLTRSTKISMRAHAQFRPPDTNESHVPVLVTKATHCQEVLLPVDLPPPFFPPFRTQPHQQNPTQTNTKLTCRQPRDGRRHVTPRHLPLGRDQPHPSASSSPAPAAKVASSSSRRPACPSATTTAAVHPAAGLLLLLATWTEEEQEEKLCVGSVLCRCRERA